MKKAVTLLCAAAAVLAGSAGAITYGEVDGDRHPNVGALVDPATGPYCSGTLVAPAVFLTAAHCAADGARVHLTFESAPTRNSRFLTGTFHANPAFSARQNDAGDLAVVVLDSPSALAPARLPAAGLLDRLKAEGALDRRARFTTVGYGAQETRPGARPQLVYKYRRELAVSAFDALAPGYLRLSQNPARGDGGACYGDSGGPNFVGAGADETAVVVAVTVTGDTFCKATNVAQRLDTPSARAFLARYVALP